MNLQKSEKASASQKSDILNSSSKVSPDLTKVQPTPEKLKELSFKSNPEVLRQAQKITQKVAQGTETERGRLSVVNQLKHPASELPTIIDRVLNWLAMQIRKFVDRMLGALPQQLWLLEMLKQRHAQYLKRKALERAAKIEAKKNAVKTQ